MKNLTHEVFKSKPYQTIVSLAKKEHKEVYLVGGFLRDLILKRSKLSLDLDFSLSCGAIDFGHRVAKALRAGFVVLDKEHGCCRVVYKDKKNNRIMTFDFVDFRAKDLKNDLIQRDFTVNTLVMPIVGNGYEILDLLGAKKDLENKTLRIAGPKSFDDDPLRILRAFSMSALFGLKITSLTMRLIDKKKKALRDVSGERLRDELFKILSVSDSWRFIALMDKHAVLEEVVPQVAIMHNVKQGGYHHLDVWGHSLETVKKLDEVLATFKKDSNIARYIDEPIGGERTRRQLIKLAALLHDVGKPKAHEVKAGKTMFHGHERIGRIIAKAVYERLKLSSRERFALDTIIFWHLRPGYLADNKVLTKRAVHRYFRDTKDEAVAVLLVSIADQRATRGPLATAESRLRHEKVSWSLMKKYFAVKEEEPFVRLINGTDLIKKLKLKPGPIFKKILNSVEEAQVEGKVRTKIQALAFARRVKIK